MIKLTDLLSEGTENNSRIIKIAASNNKGEIKKLKDVLLGADWTEKEISSAVKKRKEIMFSLCCFNIYFPTFQFSLYYENCSNLIFQLRFSKLRFPNLRPLQHLSADHVQKNHGGP